MSDLILLGTDTDAGKTSFALLWLTAFGHEYAYWKPVETGPSDTDRVRELVPAARVHDPACRFEEPVAPALAARRAGRVVPPAAELMAARPASDVPLLIETFGGPLSPLNERELQLELIRGLAGPAVVVSSSAIGAVGRSLSALRILRSAGVDVRAVVLIGPADPYAEGEIERHGQVSVIGLCPPARWDQASLAAAAAEQRHLLAGLRDRFVPAPTNSDRAGDLRRRDAKFIWHPYTSLRDPDPPLTVVGAQDEFLKLADGSRLIDGISSWWTILHGHRHPRLMAALRAATEQIDHVLFAGTTHPFAIECASRLLETAPWSGGRAFFSDNGSTAVEVALKMAYQAWCHRGEPQRTLFVGFEDGYHGDTFGAMAVGRDPLFFGRFEPLLFRAERVPVSPNQLDEVLKQNRGRVTAVITEPLVQGAGGMQTHSAETLRDLFAVARRHGVFFIADEVMTAGRTGTFWAHTQAGIAPDLICAAKTLAGGVLPLAATLAGPEVVAAFDSTDRTRTLFHGHSFTAHPLACAVAAENLTMMADGRWRDQAARIQQFWTRAVPTLTELPGVAAVRVCGTVLALDVGGGGYLAEAGRRMRAASVAAGVLLRPLGNVLYTMPPLNTSDESLGRICRAMQAAVRAAGG